MLNPTVLVQQGTRRGAEGKTLVTTASPEGIVRRA